MLTAEYLAALLCSPSLSPAPDDMPECDWPVSIHSVLSVRCPTQTIIVSETAACCCLGPAAAELTDKHQTSCGLTEILFYVKSKITLRMRNGMKAVNISTFGLEIVWY